jgi:hypothetical protein
MSQSEFLHKGYSKMICKAVSKAAIDVAIVDLVVAINFHHTNGGKRLINSLTAMAAYLQPLFFELRTSSISFPSFVRCQRLIARNVADGFLIFSLDDTF